MNHRWITISINNVGTSNDSFAAHINRGVFNLDSVRDYLVQPAESDVDEIIVDLTRVGWVSLFDWSCFITLLHRRLDAHPRLKISLDFIGDRPSGLISYQECADYIRHRPLSPKYTPDVYLHCYVVHRLLNFIKAVEGPDGFWDIAGGRLSLRYVSAQYARRSGWYRQDPAIENSVFLPRTGIAAKEMCILFATRKQIDAWRRSMVQKRVPNAAVFHSDEFWRIICHELARNVFEHARGLGFITARVVLPLDGKMPRWCSEVYNGVAMHALLRAQPSGFLELCVCDAGRGIPATIKAAYIKRYEERHHYMQPPLSPNDADLVKFAFDELGTSKDTEHSWIADRHALGHILLIVAKYGGTLAIRSGKASMVYYPADESFHRCRTQLGFEPQDTCPTDRPLPHHDMLGSRFRCHAGCSITPPIPGTHIQILIPLIPVSHSNTGTTPSVLTQQLPSAFYIDERHPLGPLVPVRDKLGAYGMCMEENKLVNFKEACRFLTGALLQGAHPRDAVLVFDFSEINWTPAQFETFLYLLQNVLVGRPVLFTNVTRAFAELVNAQEDEQIPTYLTKEMSEELHKRALEREFLMEEGKFLETYSSLGVLILALGPDEGEFLFGVRGADLRNALLDIIRNTSPQTATRLAASHGLNPEILQSVLNTHTRLFKPSSNECWESVWTGHDLAVQRLRSISSHFDNVALSCDAWRGTPKWSARLDSNTSDDRFYLPTEDAVYSEFFETSRILARERYVTEIAERLIYRLHEGLATTYKSARSLRDVDVLACATTPSVMLAEAIRRAWPVEHDGKRPVVIDYGPSLFSGADAAQVPSFTPDKCPCAIVVHDLFDEGRLSAQIVSRTETHGITVLSVLCLARFVTPSKCNGQKSIPLSPNTGWEIHPAVGMPVHAMIGLPRPQKTPKKNVKDWGTRARGQDFVVDPRSLKPVPLHSLRLESGYSEDRSLTNRDSCLTQLDNNNSCLLAAGHYVYGKRHFAVVVDVRNVLTGPIGHNITNWLADVCCDKRDRNVSWEYRRTQTLTGGVSGILLPVHSQIHYILPGLQVELAQRGRRVPHYFLDATSFGGGVETYDVPYQLRDQIEEAAREIKHIADGEGTKLHKDRRIEQRQLRLLLVDDAIFSGRTIQTVLHSIERHCVDIKHRIYGDVSDYPDPIHWVRAFVILNQLPAAKSALWHQLRTFPASSLFQFDAYAPFTGVASFSAEDCPACKEVEHLKYVADRVEGADATDAYNWIEERRTSLAPVTTEAPSFQGSPSEPLPEPIDVLAPFSKDAAEHYKPLRADSAIWRFYELVYLSYPLGDILVCLSTTREAGHKHRLCRHEYARFRLAVYDWCIRNWHQVRLYHVEDQVLDELKAEIKEGEPLFVEVVYRLNGIVLDSSVTAFIKWAIDYLGKQDADARQTASDSAMALDTGLTLLLLTVRRSDLDTSGLIDYLRNTQANAPRKSSFLSFLYLRLTRPMRVADPAWALTAIAETCFRGRLGNTPEMRRRSDHELLGYLVANTARKPSNQELRRRLEGSLHAFIAATENLQPYFDEDLLSGVTTPARLVLKWLRLSPEEALADITPVKDLNVSLQNSDTWVKFAVSCHMSVAECVHTLKRRLTELRHLPQHTCYKEYEPDIQCDAKIREWCLMTHIPRLVACISNIAFEPVARVTPTQPCRVVFTPCALQEPQSILVDVTTYFGSAPSACQKMKSTKITHSLNELRRFGVGVRGPSPALEDLDNALRISFVIPVGFQPE